MGPYAKAALFLIRLVGFGLLSIGVLLLAGDLFLIFAKHEPARRAMLGLEGVLLFGGMVVLVKSSAMARRLTEDFDDE